MWWDVYLNGKIIDSLYCDKNCDEWSIKDGLINHDNYHPNIKIRRRKINKNKGIGIIKTDIFGSPYKVVYPT